MNNEVSLQTAIALKEAGFLQPLPKFGQIWHDGEGQKILIIAHNVGKSGRAGWSDGVETGLYENEYVPDGVFAPMATDILQQIPKALIGFNNAEWSAMLYDSPMTFNHANPAEAAAMAWLAINKKT